MQSECVGNWRILWTPEIMKVTTSAKFAILDTSCWGNLMLVQTTLPLISVTASSQIPGPYSWQPSQFLSYSTIWRSQLLTTYDLEDLHWIFLYIIEPTLWILSLDICCIQLPRSPHQQPACLIHNICLLTSKLQWHAKSLPHLPT